MTEAHRTQIRVLYGDVDSMKVAYYGNYMRWFELGRAEYMRNRGFPYSEAEKRGVFLPVIEAFCKYRKSVRYDDLIWIEARPEDVRRVKVRFAYRILNEAEECMAEGYTVHAAVDETGRVVRLPDFLLEALSDDASEGVTTADA